MKARYKVVDRLLADLETKYDELTRLPINVFRLIKKMGVLLVEKEFGSSLSGAAMVDGDRRIVSVNKAEPEKRRRFTAAHELGHLLLHSDQSLNVDLKPVAYLRNQVSSSGREWREIEANYFASSLLMPRTLLTKEMELLGKKHEDEEELINALATKFNVSPQAMAIRLGTLARF